jgi:hypothetical protein
VLQIEEAIPCFHGLVRPLGVEHASTVLDRTAFTVATWQTGCVGSLTP